MKTKLIHWFKLQKSYNEMERFFHYGIITYNEFWAYVSVWEWCSPRMGGRAGEKQDKFWEKYGKEAYYKRINKVRAAFGFDLITNY